MTIYLVQVKSHDDDTIAKQVECDTERKAAKMDEALNLNLNHYVFYTDIVEKECER